jgi:NAD(P)H-hydrate epimerase
VVVGGSTGMAGATVLAARGALRSGIGMVKLCVARDSIQAVQAQEPAAMATPWPDTDSDMDAIVSWADILLIGPGLGISARATALLDRLLAAWKGPVVLDADAFRPFDGKPDALRALLGDRSAVLTPHAVEFARLAGLSLADITAQRFDVVAQVARTVGATVLLKGVPTIVTDGESTWVSAAGTPVLATGGSGDVLGGIVATLLAQSSGARGDAPAAAAAAAWIHGRAAEIAGAGHVRGVTLTNVIDALRDAWRLDRVAPEPPILAELPAVGEHT